MNLLLLCPTCHTKIEKGYIQYEDVAQKKSDLLNKSWKIEFVSLVLDTKCDYETSPINQFAFFNTYENKTPLPVLSFVFINHTNKTIVLKSIEAKMKILESGIYGIGDPFMSEVLESLIKYRLHIIWRKALNILNLQNPISIPSKKSFMFQIELSEGPDRVNINPIENRKAVYLSFKFSSEITINIPTICFNCNADDEPLLIQSLN